MSKPTNLDKPKPEHPHLRQLAYLEYLLDFDLGLIQHIDDWQEGFPAVTAIDGSGATSKGGHSDRVMHEATRGADSSQPPPRPGHGLTDQAIDLHHRIIEAVAYLRDLAREARRSGLKPLPPGLADLKARSASPTGTGVGYCAVTACEHLCSGGLNDQLVKGFCPTCRRAWDRNLQRDEPLTRQQFIDTRTPRNVQWTHADNETAGDPPHPPDEALPSGFTGRSDPGDTAA